MDAQASFELRTVLPSRRAGWNRLLLIVPALALVAIASAGLSGPAAKSSDPAQVAAAAPAASTLPVVAVPPSPNLPRPLQVALKPVPLVPKQVLGVEVHGVRAIIRADIADPVVAVTGWYAPGPMLDCPPEAGAASPGFVAELGVVSDSQTFCERSGMLYAAAPSSDASKLPGLRVRMRPGIVVPPPLGVEDEVGNEVVFVGRLERSPDLCTAFRTRCRPEVLVDRVVWVAGLGRAQTTTILPSMLDLGPLLSWRPRDRLAEAAVGQTGAILMETLVDLATLASVDPDAAAAVTLAEPDARRIWYRRVLGQDPARDDPRWIAIDDSSGQVLGSGTSPR